MAEILLPDSSPPTTGFGSGRRESILIEATRLFSEQGYNDADTQVLAERLGVGKGTLYRCFASKRELFLAAVDRAMRSLQEFIDSRTEGVADPLESVSVGIRAYLEFFDANPECVELVMQERALFRDRRKPTFFEHRERRAEQWRRVYEVLIASGRLRAIAPETICDVIGQLLYGTVFTNYFLGRQKSFDEQAREIVDVIFQGILSEAERGRFSAEVAIPPRATDVTSSETAG